MLKGTAKQAHTVNCRMRIQGESRGTAKAEAAQRQYEDRAVERGAKRTKSRLRETRTDTTATSTSSSSSSGAAPASSSSSSGDAVRTGSAEGGEEPSRVGNKRNAEEEWVELPDEFEKRVKYASLRRWLYGMSKAATGWEDDYVWKLVNDGFERGKAASTIFYQLETHVRAVVHGDDYHVWSHRKDARVVRYKGAWRLG